MIFIILIFLNTQLYKLWIAQIYNVKIKANKNFCIKKNQL